MATGLPWVRTGPPGSGLGPDLAKIEQGHSTDPGFTVVAASAGIRGQVTHRPHGRGRSLIPAASRSTTSVMRAARRSGRRVVASIQRR